EQSGHRPDARRGGLLHEATAEADRTERRGEIERADDDPGRPLAEAVTGRDRGGETSLFREHTRDRDGGGEESGLCVLGEGEPILRPVPGEAAQVRFEGRVRLGEGPTRGAE